MLIKQKAHKIDTLILGGGMTGLAAGLASGFPVFEAAKSPGGICSSYYVSSNDNNHVDKPIIDGNAYRFEIGGGHWIFGGDPTTLNFINRIAPMRSYARKSSVFFPKTNTFVPYPLQNNLRFLNNQQIADALDEMVHASNSIPTTMAEWIRKSFGETLTDLFFGPFHQLYSAGLWNEIAPQDAYKSPVDLSLAIRGAIQDVQSVGYNVTFVYPEEGLDQLSRKMAAECDIRYDKRVVEVDTNTKAVSFADGTNLYYKNLLSTLPLNKMVEMTKIYVEEPTDPYTSVLVLNIGAVRGEKCPDDHWLYIPRSKSGFHRVGFYSNVDASFLPVSARQNNDRVSIYIERAFVGNQKPSSQEIEAYQRETIAELQNWEFVENVEVVDPTWIEVAYTWKRPESRWREKALLALEKENIYQIGRYARWQFQGIADSIRDGFFAGASFK